MDKDARSNVTMLLFVFLFGIVANILDFLFNPSGVISIFIVACFLIYPIVTYVMFTEIPDKKKFGWPHALWLILDALLVLWGILTFSYDDVDPIVFRALVIPHFFGLLLIPKLI